MTIFRASVQLPHVLATVVSFETSVEQEKRRYTTDMQRKICFGGHFLTKARACHNPHFQHPRFGVSSFTLMLRLRDHLFLEEDLTAAVYPNFTSHHTLT